MSQRAFNFKELKVLIIDEADLIIEHGSTVKMSQIIDKLPKLRRTGLFSATMTSSIKDIAKLGMRNPYLIEIQNFRDKQYE